MVDMAMLNVQRKITLKVGRAQLKFMCFACRLIVLYIFVKFGENILDGIRVMEQTQMTKALTDRQTDILTDVYFCVSLCTKYPCVSKIRHTRLLCA